MLRATQHPLLFELYNSKLPDLVFPDNRDSQELAIDSRPVYEEDDMGQMTVIAHDPKFASPLQRIQNLSALTRLQREKRRN